MSVAVRTSTIHSLSSSRCLSTKDSSQSKKSGCSGDITSEHGSKFGRAVTKFPKQNDPSLVHSVSIVNSRVIRALVNFPVKIHSKLPDLTHMEATDCIRKLGNFFDILDYEFNYASFWILDILSKLIKHMQLRRFSVLSQNISLIWFRFVLRSISISGAPREEVFCILQEMFLKAEESIKKGNSIPQPEEIINEHKKSMKLMSGDLMTSRQSRKSLSQKSSKSTIVSERKLSSKSSKSNRKSSRAEENVEENLQTLYFIIEMIYKVFANRFMFSLISQAYSSPTIAAPVDILLDFKEPKQLRPILVVTPPPSPKSKKPSVSKSAKKGKDKGKGKLKTSPTSKDETETDGMIGNESNKKSKKGKNKEKGKPGKKGGKEGKEKEKTFLNLSNQQEEANETKAVTKEKRGKTKNKSKSSSNIETEQAKKNIVDSKTKNEKQKRSSSLKNIKDIKICSLEEKLKLFDTSISPEMKLKMKKIEVKDKFILPLSESVGKDYVGNLINSLLPPEAKTTNNAKVSKEKNEEKSRKSLKGKKKKSMEKDKKTKGKKNK